VLFGDDWYSDAELGDLAGKDAALGLRGIWVHEFAEIDTLARQATGTLKRFLSSATDRIREPYGRVVEDSPRRCVFVGTVNEGGYLKDSTGGRRFWPLEVRKPIDVAKIARDRDQLWAEAAALEAAGESLELPRELWAMAGERQAEQTSGDPWADTLRGFLGQRKAVYERADAADADAGEDGEGLPILPPDRVHSSELYDALGIAVKDQTKDKAQRLRTVMESVVGWHYRRVVRVGEAVSSGYTREHLANRDTAEDV
jgi:predicted P-loop ATPase